MAPIRPTCPPPRPGHARRVGRFALSMALGAFALVAALPSARAGFEWSPPARSATTPMPAPVFEAPAAPLPPTLDDSSSLPVPAPLTPSDRSAAPAPVMAQPLAPRPAATPAPRPLAVAPSPALDGQPVPSMAEIPAIDLQPLKSDRSRRDRLATLQSAQGPAPSTAPLSPLPRPPSSSAPDFAPPKELARRQAQQSAPPPSFAPAPYASPRFPDAVGFGRDVPLALALRQIVPPSYGFSFADGVDQGQRISWTGGKPWDQALDAALRPKGLGASISANTVRIAPLAMPSIPRPPAAARPDSAAPGRGLLTPVPSPIPAERSSFPRAPDASVPSPRSAMKDIDAENLPPLLAPSSGIVEAPPIPLTRAPASPGFPKGLVKAPGPVDVPAVSSSLASQPASPPVGSPPPSLPEIAQASTHPVPLRTPEIPGISKTLENSETLANMEPAAGMKPASLSLGRKFAPRTGAFDMDATQEWSAPAGATLRRVLTDWSEKAGVQLHWSSQFDYPIQAHIQMTTTYQKAVETLLDGLRDAKPRPLARLHPNLPAGPAILILQTQQVIN